MNCMSTDAIVNSTRAALQDQQVVQHIFQECFRYDQLIKEDFNGDYSIKPLLIFPFLSQNQEAISMVRFEVIRDNRLKFYNFIFNFGQQDLHINLLSLGSTNTDPFLFKDALPAVFFCCYDRSRNRRTSS